MGRDGISDERPSWNIVGALLYGCGLASSWCSQSTVTETAKHCQHPSLKWKTFKRHRITHPSTNPTTLTTDITLRICLHIANQSLVPANLRRHPSIGKPHHILPRWGLFLPNFPPRLSIDLFISDNMTAAFPHLSIKAVPPRTAQPGLWFSGIILP